MTTSTAPVAKLSGPGDVVVMIPYVLGFLPTESLVVVSLEGPRRRFGPLMRVDLVTGAREVVEQVNYVAAFIEAHRFRDVILVAYSEDASRAGCVVRPLLRKLRSTRVRVAEALRADGSRWYSYVCHKQCCPPAGVPYDMTSDKASAEAVVHGMTFAESRDALRSTFDPASPELVAAVQALVPALVAEVEGGGMDHERIDQLLAGDEIEFVRHLATCLVLSQDTAWGPSMVVHVSREHARDQFDLWASVVQVAHPEQLAGPGALAAFFAWLDGDGVLASHALDRVDAVHDDHPLAALVRSLLDRTVPPDIWDQIQGEEVVANP